MIEKKRVEEMLGIMRQEVPHYGIEVLTFQDLIHTADAHGIKIIIEPHPSVKESPLQSSGYPGCDATHHRGGISFQYDSGEGPRVILITPDMPIGYAAFIFWHEMAHIIIQEGADSPDKEAEANLIAAVGIVPIKKMTANREHPAETAYFTPTMKSAIHERIDFFKRYEI